MLNFASHELSELRESGGVVFDFTFNSAARAKPSRVKIIRDKIRVPPTEAAEAARAVYRPRLFAHLEKSLAHFSATLLTGRTGTGKTWLAADFARRLLKNGAFDYVAWYKADATDGERTVFLSYLEASLKPCAVDFKQSASAKNSAQTGGGDQSTTDALAWQFARIDQDKSLLIVLDDLHTVFDAEWFAEFFNALLSLPAANVRLLLLARTAPPFPLLRLRSKHALDVLDEKLLAFTPDETIEFFRRYKLPESDARAAHKIAYGKIAKLKEIAEKKR